MKNESLIQATDMSACTCSNLRKAARMVTQAYDNTLRSVGLRVTQFTLLGTLAGRGNLPLTKLLEVVGEDRTILKRNLQPLVRRDLIRTENEDDHRVRMVVLTDVGRNVFEVARHKWDEMQMQMQMSMGLGQERWSGLLKDLSGITAIVSDG
jgi:DNA-binding MarR family transcriptional regulator